MDKLKKFFNLLSIVFIGYGVVILLLSLLTRVGILGGAISFLSMLAEVFLTWAIIVLGKVGFPIVAVLTFVLGYFLEKKRQGIKEKGFSKKALLKSLPSFVVNLILMVALLLVARYFHLHDFGRFF